MKMDYIVSDGTKAVSPSDERSMTNILVNLEKMGIDPEPFFILAAREFENIYGENAGEKARLLYANAITEQDEDGACVWHKIQTLISDNSQNSLRNIH
ncbi:hypothetical protein [Emcibacter sp.]|uniref:hypothetical protein n=1 Tax=Emcibacter sp. TaxID=1979954 RepID=UPI003A95B30D